LRLPLIGLPTLAIPPGPKPARFGINQSYVRALVNAGCAPVLIPLLEEEDRLRAIYERLDGMVFPGGADVAPGQYGEEPIANLNVVEAARDRTELTLARWATEADLPILGICRGQQLLNVALGGSLYQVRLDPGSRLAQLLDETEVEVNSLHHQAVKRLAGPLRISGRSDDGVIEAVESRTHRFLIAVQWHPEEIDDLPWVRRLFSAFATAASG
jgi:putative glutamine amidotransferase